MSDWHKEAQAGRAVLCAWSAGILAGIELVRSGQPTQDLEQSARHAIAMSMKQEKKHG